MTSRFDIERVLDRYIAEGAEQVPDRVIDAVLDQVAHIPQRRALRLPWRSNGMPAFPRLALSGAAVVALVVVGSMFLNRGQSGTTGGAAVATPSPSASPTASATPSPSASLDLTHTSDWVAFTSDRYSYRIAHPSTWTATAATIDRGIPSDKGPNASSDQIRFGDAIFYAYAVDMPSATSEDEWIRGNLEGCSPRFKDAQPVSVDDHAGRIFVRDNCDDSQAFVFKDGRVHVFVVWRPNQDGLLEAFLSTVEFQQ